MSPSFNLLSVGLPSARGSDRTRHALRGLLILVLMPFIMAVVYKNGGAVSFHLAFFVLPVMMAGLWFGLMGGLLIGVAAALSVAPGVVPDSLMGIPYYTESWLVRGGALCAIGGVTGYIQNSAWRQARATIQAGRIDPMSGLPNKVALFADLSATLQDSRDNADCQAVVLLKATDLDDIVDVVGLDGGDAVIRELAQHLCSISPNVTGYYRFSPSEIALTVAAEDMNTLKMLARSLHNAAGVAFDVAGAPIRVEPVLGVGHAGLEKDMSAGEIVRRARVALRHAVQRDKSWVAYEPDFETDTARTIELIARAEEALKEGEFELYFQPKIHLASKEPRGVEALIRWNRPGEGVISPGSFMPKLEQTSLITPFSRFVLRSAMDYARTNPLLPVSINLSVRNLVDEDLVAMFSQEIEETGVSPESLEVEITESAIMRYPEITLSMLNRLREMGIGIALDDFGTGYSSFSYLERMPFTNLKIDREFIQPLEGNVKTRRLVLAMIETGHMLNLTVTAEGVETEGQARILEDIGCDFGQGFLWSAARPLGELKGWLEARHV